MAGEGSENKDDGKGEKPKVPGTPPSAKVSDSLKEIKPSDLKEVVKEEEKKKKKDKSPKKSKKRSTKSQQAKKKDKKTTDKPRRTKEEPALSKTPSSPSDNDHHHGGETLAPCSEKEWETGQAAYNTSLLNVKRKANKISVFSVKKTGGGGSPVPQQSAERKRRSSSDKKKKATEASMDRADHIGKIVAGIVRKYLEGKNEESIQVEIKLIANDGASTTLIEKPALEVNLVASDPIEKLSETEKSEKTQQSDGKHH